MSSPAGRKRIAALEDLLAPAVEATGKVNQALQRHPKFPIDIHVAEDKAWRTYEQFVQQVQKR